MARRKSAGVGGVPFDSTIGNNGLCSAEIPLYTNDMSTGSLKLHVTDLRDGAIEGKLLAEFRPQSSSPGGTAMDAEFSLGGETDLVVNGIQCRGGPGTLCIVRVSTRNFRSYGMFQLILEKKVNTPSESHFRLMVKPKRVRDIKAPGFSALGLPLRRFLDTAGMLAPKPEDRDLLGRQGKGLYDALGPLRKACLLNIFTKASHVTAGRCFRFIRSALVIRQDRCFCSVASGMPEALRRSDRFKSAKQALHKPLSGFQLEDSFKSKDDYANLQVTFMRHKQSGDLAADVDIDESSGIEHGFEVIRNTITKGRTNPYLIRELMLLFDPVEKVLDPGYGFLFG